MDTDDMEFSDAEMHLERPECFCCPVCQLNFTKRALEVHRNSCKETQDCECQTCTICRKDKNSRIPNGESNSLSIIETLTANEETEDHTENFGDNADTGKDLSTNITLAERSEKENVKHDEVTCTRKLFCRFCDDHISYSSYGLHIIEHSSNINGFFDCPFPGCQELFSETYFLLLHYFKHTEHPLTCKDCRCYYHKCNDFTNDPFDEHCHNETFCCYICLVVCRNSKSLVSHMHEHAKEMPFICKSCKRGFSSQEHLTRHSTVLHVRKMKPECSFSNKVFRCTVCGKAFSKRSDLKRHMDSHFPVKIPQSTEIGSIPNENDNGILSTYVNGATQAARSILNEMSNILNLDMV